MNPRIQALQQIVDECKTCNPIEAFKLYAAAEAIARSLVEENQGKDGNEKHLEDAKSFINKLRYALVDHANDEERDSWLSSAESMLTKLYSLA